jgi:hypothetical protein
MKSVAMFSFTEVKKLLQQIVGTNLQAGPHESARVNR